MTQQSGLTLIELLLTMAILAILTTVAVPGFSNLVLKHAHDGSRKPICSRHSPRQAKRSPTYATGCIM